MSEFKGTKGPWGRSIVLTAADTASVMINAAGGQIRTAFRMSTALPRDPNDGREVQQQLEADAELVCEAGTVLHETGLRPRELVQKVAELERRLAWLHSESSNNVNGYEWGIYRVKWVNGVAAEVWQTNSDFSDLDAAMQKKNHCDKHTETGLACTDCMATLPELTESQRAAMNAMGTDLESAMADYDKRVDLLINGDQPIIDEPFPTHEASGRPTGPPDPPKGKYPREFG